MFLKKITQFTETAGISLMMIGFCTFLSHCSLFEKNIRVKPGDFDYFSISKNYFQPPVNRPFPLTVQKGNNLYSSVTADGRYMYFTSDKKGNQDIYLRDLNSSVVVQITSHPASEFKPAVSPDGRKLAFVSTKFDPNGDLVLMDVNPEKTVKDSLKGIYPNEEFENFLTAKGGEDRFTDTDPVFTPDGKSILFVSDRFTPGLPNLVLLTLGKKEMVPLTKDGAASPRISDDGRYILFISRKDDIHGEVYRYDRVSGVTERLTSDSYPDFSPSISPDGNYAFFVSIRKDSNGNGILDERDESVIVRKDLRSKKEKILSAPAVSAFDAKYSGFNGGSIVYSAPKFNAINIYFIPVTGSIAKQENIVEQFRYAERYRDDPEPENYRLALDSIDFYFSEDPLFPLYKSQYEYETVLKEISRKTRLEKTARLEEELSRKGDRLFGILIHCHLKKLQGKDCTKILEAASSEKNLADWKDKDTAPFVLSLAGQEAERISNFQEAEKKYSEIIKKYPDYHQINSVREKIGELSMLKKGSGWLPEMFREILASGDSGFEDRKTVLNALEKSIKKNRSPEERITLADSALKEKDWKKEVPYIHSILSYIKAESQFELKKFKESNETADSYLPPLPPENPECQVNWQCVKPRACSIEDPFCLKGHLLKSKNFEGLGQVRPMFDELRIYLENYETSSGVVMDIKDMEKSFRYFENRANEFEIRDRLLEAALHHFYNTENMFLLKSRNLYVDSIYKKYAVYFQKKMVDSVLKLAKSQADEEKNRLPQKLNPLGQENLDAVGKLSRFLVWVLDNRLTKDLKDRVDIRNLDTEHPLGRPGARDDALLLIEQHFNLSRPRARPILYHPALFGYAYYLINKNIAYDAHYRETKRMTAARKDKILESLKLAEYELKWIIFSEPTYSEAYQLLGWLYQYIDQSKSVRLKDSTRLEGEEFAESYEKYFPERHLEENIELYQQIIEFISDSENSKVLADLHLNLGNNYLLLNKFSEAEASYSKTEKFHRKISHSQRFEDYRQEALFFYNFGRTLLFAKKYSKAADYFVKASDIYSYNELYKKADLHKSEEKNPPEQKLAVLNAFIGLSNMEGGNFKEAVYYFKKSLALNLNRNYLDTMGLYNALSICYRNMGDFRLSSHFASESRKIYGKKSDFSLNFSSPSESFSRLIFTEDTTVNGKSRFPYGFKDEHQYLLSLGIEMGNQEDQNEFRRSAEIIEERKNFIEDKSLDRTFTGQLILKKDEWRDALHSICGDRSDEKLKTVLSVLSSVTDQEKFQRMKRLGYRIMKSVPEECRDRKEPLLRKTASLLVQFRNSEVSVCRSKKNTLENCSDEFGRAYPEYDIFLAYVFRQLSLEVKNPVLSLYYSGNSAELLEKAGGVSREVYYLPGDPLSKSARLHSRINYAGLLLDMNETAKFSEVWKESDYYAEDFADHSSKFALYLLKLKELKKAGKLSLRKEYLKKADSVFLNHYEVMKYADDSIVREYLKLAEEIHIEDKDAESLIFRKDFYLYWKIFQAAFSAKLRFEDDAFRKSYEESFFLLKKLDETEQSLKKTFQFSMKIPELSDEKRNLNLKIRASLLSLSEKDRSKRKILLFNEKSEISSLPSKGITVFRIFEGSRESEKFISVRETDSGRIMKSFSNLRSAAEFIAESENSSDSIRMIVSEKKETETELKKILPASEKLHYSRTVPIWNSERQISLEKTFILKPKERLGNDVYNYNVISGRFRNVSYSNVFGESAPGFLSLKDFFLKKHFVSAVINDSSALNEQEEKMLSAVLPASSVPVFIRNLQGSVPESFSGSSLKKQSSFICEGCALISDAERKPDIKYILNLEAEEKYSQAAELLQNLMTSPEHKDSILLKTAEARIKSKLFKIKDRLFFFHHLLSSVSSDADRLTVGRNLLKYCFSRFSSQLCEKDYQDFVLLELNPAISSDIRKKSMDYIKIYRFLSSENYREIRRLETEPPDIESEFSHKIELAGLLRKNFLLDEASRLYSELSAAADSPAKKEILRREFNELDVLARLSGVRLQKTSLKSTENSIHSTGIARNWVRFAEKQKEIEEEGHTDSIISFRGRLYDTWKKLETGAEYNFQQLKDDSTALGESFYSLLDDRDRILIFNIFSRSVPYQRSDEVNELVDSLLKDSSGMKRSLAGYLTLSYAETLFNRGDIDASLKYLNEYHRKFRSGISDDLEKRGGILAKKISYLGKKSEFDSEAENEYFEYYRTGSSEEKAGVYSTVRKMLKDKAEENFSSYHRREIQDLLFFLQGQAIRLNSSDLLFDLAWYRDRLNALSDRFYSRNVKFKDLPEFKPLSKSILSTLPQDQSFVGAVHYGNTTYGVQFENGNFTGKVLFEYDKEDFDSSGTQKEDIYRDNRVLRNDIYDYYRKLNAGESAILKKEFQERRFRKALDKLDKLFKEKYGKPRPEKKRRTYLYLTSFIFKIPFELKDDDDIFLVQSPELLTENRPVSMKKIFQKNSRIKKYHNPGFRPTGFIEKLRDIEIKESPGTDPPVYAALQDLDLSEDEKIYFGGRYIQEEKVPYSPSLWILGSSGMYESAFFKDDMNHALKYFDKVYYGPGIFTIGPQKGSISTVHFLKTLLESRNSELDLRGKFVNALKAQKTNYPYELDWVGYRLYTNCYLAD